MGNFILTSFLSPSSGIWDFWGKLSALENSIHRRDKTKQLPTRSHYSPFRFPLTNCHPSVVSGNLTSHPDLHFYKCRCRVGISLMAWSASGVWLPVWVWDASFLHLASHVIFDSTSDFSCKSFSHSPEELPGFLAAHLPSCFSLPSGSTTAGSCLSHCHWVTGLLGVSANPHLVSHRAKFVTLSKAVCEVMSQFWIRTQRNF